MTPINVVKVNCKFNLSDYINEYNTLYNENILLDSDEKLEMNIVYYSTGIGKINIDYTKINKIINQNDNSINYSIKLVNTDENDFTEIHNFFKKSIGK